MSRSYKKNVGHVDLNPFMKNYANRRLRRKSVDEDIPSGASYKKNSSPWDICDWRCIYFEGYNEYREWEVKPLWGYLFRNYEPPTEEEMKRDYARMRSK